MLDAELFALGGSALKHVLAGVVRGVDDADLGSAQGSGAAGDHYLALSGVNGLYGEDIVAFCIGSGVLSIELANAGCKINGRNAVGLQVIDGSGDNGGSEVSDDCEYLIVLNELLQIGFTLDRIELVVIVDKGDLTAVNAARVVNHVQISLDAGEKWNADRRISTGDCRGVTNLDLGIGHALRAVIGGCSITAGGSGDLASASGQREGHSECQDCCKDTLFHFFTSLNSCLLLLMSKPVGWGNKISCEDRYHLVPRYADMSRSSLISVEAGPEMWISPSSST
ncbi:hypothetical protein SDC9_130112 [bioreactor metagenome]|uniref:Uncharacterized protein n=1 Tax=bioreactor metagenome TaxID=1076179 RepID=A0A645D1J6_9ZZZZ